MQDFRIRSKIRFENEITKLFKDLMVSCLDRAEKFLNPDRNNRDWQQFRFGILNIGNDKIRYFKERLEDYAIEFRPAIFSVEYNNLPTSLDNLAGFEFVAEDTNNVRFVLKTTSLPNLEAIKEALGCGEIKGDGKKWAFIVNGMMDVFHKLIPFFDYNNCFKGNTLERYIEWKEKVYSLEKGNA